MKKFFTLIAATIIAVVVNAETLINYPTSQDGITVGGSTEFDAVKIKTNKTSVNGIKFANSYKSDEAANGNHAELTIEGGFKAGDKIIVAGAFNNSDDSKLAKVDIFTLDGTTPTTLWTSQQFVNGRLVDDDPVEETYTLEADAEKLYIGRNGNTTTYITTLKVVRGEEDADQGGDSGDTPAGSALIDYPTSLNGITIGGTCTTDETVKIHGNKDAVQAIQFKNGYTTNSVIKENYATLTVDGGFKAGDVITVAGVFNNADDTKQSAVTLFTGEEGEKNTDIWTSQLFINGRTATEDPTPETYTLEADYASLKLGRANGLTGATGTWVTLLKVERESTTGVSEVLNVKVAQDGAIYNMAGQKVDASYKGIVIQNGKKFVNK